MMYLTYNAQLSLKRYWRGDEGRRGGGGGYCIIIPSNSTLSPPERFFINMGSSVSLLMIH